MNWIIFTSTWTVLFSVLYILSYFLSALNYIIFTATWTILFLLLIEPKHLYCYMNCKYPFHSCMNWILTPTWTAFSQLHELHYFHFYINCLFTPTWPGLIFRHMNRIIFSATWTALFALLHKLPYFHCYMNCLIFTATWTEAFSLLNKLHFQNKDTNIKEIYFI